jgi:hypothetical protein
MVESILFGGEINKYVRSFVPNSCKVKTARIIDYLPEHWLVYRDESL